MTRTETDIHVSNLPQLAGLAKEAWSEGDIGKFEVASRDLEKGIQEARRIFKDDLYREATKPLR